MHPLVRDLYKRFLLVGRDYPLGLPYVREKVGRLSCRLGYLTFILTKAAFFKNAHIQSEDELMRAIYKGRWWVKEMSGIIQLRKYRAMRSKYGAGAGIGSEAPSDYTLENLKEPLSFGNHESVPSATNVPPTKLDDYRTGNG